MERLQQKYGNVNPFEDEGYSEESSESEDDEGKLLTDKAENKFLELIYKIRKGDASLKN